MNKKIYLLCACISFCLCACQRTVPEDEMDLRETEVSAPQEDELSGAEADDQVIEPTEKPTEEPFEEPSERISDNKLLEEGMEFLNEYDDLCAKENAKRMALIYLDEDTVPELLILGDGEYRLYSFDGSQVKAAAMSDTGIKASAYGSKHDFEDSVYQTFYWFEYVPYKGLIRVHSGDDKERHDYYLKYTDGLFEMELEAKSMDRTWHTYDAEKEIENEEFLSQLTDMGYDQLVPCAYLYENVAAAYENIGAVSNTQKVLEDFVNGKIDALDHVEKITDIPEEGFVMKSYEDYYSNENYENDESDLWKEIEYIDFDNDGEDELMIRSYAGLCSFFDVIGDTVYNVLETSGSTTDVASVGIINDKRVIERTDLSHGGRKSYRIMKYDSCCCLIDWFHLYTEYKEATYSESDRFEYRNREITMEEFEEIVGSIQQEAD